MTTNVRKSRQSHVSRSTMTIARIPTHGRRTHRTTFLSPPLVASPTDENIRSQMCEMEKNQHVATRATDWQQRLAHPAKVWRLGSSLRLICFLSPTSRLCGCSLSYVVQRASCPTLRRSGTRQAPGRRNSYLSASVRSPCTWCKNHALPLFYIVAWQRALNLTLGVRLWPQLERS